MNTSHSWAIEVHGSTESTGSDLLHWGWAVMTGSHPLRAARMMDREVSCLYRDIWCHLKYLRLTHLVCSWVSRRPYISSITVCEWIKPPGSRKTLETPHQLVTVISTSLFPLFRRFLLNPVWWPCCPQGQLSLGECSMAESFWNSPSN